MAPIDEDSEENADDLAQEVVNYCAKGMAAGVAVRDDLMALLDPAQRYLTAKRTRDNPDFDKLTELEAEVITTRNALLGAYKTYREKKRHASA